MEKAVFALRDIVFNEIHVESHNLPKEDKISIDFEPSCEIDLNKNESTLTVVFKAFGEGREDKSNFIYLGLTSKFEFSELSSKDDIPEYFFGNALAMVYPYIRAFVTNIIFQANLERKIILPTMNLSSFAKELESNTKYLTA